MPALDEADRALRVHGVMAVKREILEGPGAAVIMNAASTHADLIVMDSRGRNSD